MAYTIVITDGAREELRLLAAGHRALVLRAIARHLVERPGIEEGKKKVIQGIRASWQQNGDFWQLTVVPYRVFYTVDEATQTVSVEAVRKKPPGKTTEEIV